MKNLLGNFRTILQVQHPREAENGTTEEAEGARGHWGSRAEFLLSCIGMSVGLGNIWRFPYLAYQNGGAAFLFPYMILLLLVGKPMYLMEVTIGQFASVSSVEIWNCCPIAKGVGLAMMVISVIVAIYYNVVVCYTIFYMAASFASEVPWKECFPWWGPDENCYVRAMHGGNSSSNASINSNTSQTPSEQYWERYVLHRYESQGIGDLGEVRWELALCLLLCWIIVFFCLYKGIRSSGKVVYFTATFPYLILLILLIRGVTLEGASIGLHYLFVPEWDKLLDINVWYKAAEQMFYSLGVAWGSLIMFGSYNPFRNKTHVDAMIVSILDFGTSLIGSIAIFSVLGFMSHSVNLPINKVASSGPGLAFITYPEAIAMLPLPQLWAVLFFFMLFTLGLDSEFATLESVLTNIYDRFPKLRKHKILMTLLACVVCFLLGLPCVTNGGQYVFSIMDTFGSGFSVMIIAFFEMIAFMWIYGVRNFSNDIEFMLGFQPSIYWKICWTVCCPLTLGVLIFFALYNLEPAKYDDNYVYENWAQIMGWCLTALSIISIPIWAIYELVKRYKEGDILNAFRPTPKWGPSDPALHRNWKEFKGLTFPSSERNNLSGIDNPAISRSTLTLGKPFDTSRF